MLLEDLDSLEDLQLADESRADNAADWAATQNNLGIALATLGERESGGLDEAVAAYRAALEERTRDRVPLLWATTRPTSALRSKHWGSATVGRRVWRRRSTPTGRRWRNGPAIACRSNGP
jgi:hypothetical protein